MGQPDALRPHVGGCGRSTWWSSGTHWQCPGGRNGTVLLHSAAAVVWDSACWKACQVTGMLAHHCGQHGLGILVM